MALLRLRGPSGPDTLQRVILDGVEYLLRWRYIQTEARWSLDVSSAGGVLLAAGIRVVQLAPLFAEVRAGRPADVFPPGEMFVGDDRTASRTEPGLDELGSTLPLFYAEATDLV